MEGSNSGRSSLRIRRFTISAWYLNESHLLWREMTIYSEIKIAFPSMYLPKYLPVEWFEPGTSRFAGANDTTDPPEPRPTTLLNRTRYHKN